MSLGTLVSALPKGVTEAVAQAFAQLPHKVVWRFLGERPSSLGNNTLLLDWLPQNDLLGHPKTRAFVAHGGTNGLYEAIYHGVPVLVEQCLEATTLTTKYFLEALRDVLENPSYCHSMQKLFGLHRNTPLSPFASATFWIEYVMRNGVPPAHRSLQHVLVLQPQRGRGGAAHGPQRSLSLGLSLCLQQAVLQELQEEDQAGVKDVNID
ncbi:unnamed protein product [Coregonus sp. 'balchen']|nr:unnamed protein product [Coregonus sp. 'balchen']